MNRIAEAAVIAAATSLSQLTLFRAGAVHSNLAEVASLNQVASRAAWEPRDAATAIVHSDQMWLMGGWTGVGLETPRDVWVSSDGTTWQQVRAVAPWKHGDAAMGASFKGSMWLFGGIHNPRLPDETFSNEIWSSEDGAHWINRGRAAWSPRAASAIVTFKDRLWLLGGHDRKHYSNEVWSSADGVNWVLEASAPWSERAFHSAVAFKNRIWLMGGGKWEAAPTMLNDVWSSPDGKTWERVTEQAPWRGKLWTSAIVYRDSIWMVGGRIATGEDSPKIWRSEDGIGWEAVSPPAEFPGRHATALWSLADKVWIGGGYRGDGKTSNDVWALSYRTEDTEPEVRRGLSVLDY